MNIKLIVFFYYLSIKFTNYLVRCTISAIEAQIIDDCLASFGGLNEENAKRLMRFKEWSSSYEEFPCFTKCYIDRYLNIYTESYGFNRPNIITRYGQLAYDKCEMKLKKFDDTCFAAYQGFHCLIKLETDPHVFIDKIPIINAEAKDALKYCLLRFPKKNWFDYLILYQQYPVKEPVPCYTRCFVDKLQLFSYRLRQWNMTALQATLGVPKSNTNYDNCLELSKHRNRNLCEWIYTELTCFSLAL